MHPTDRSFDPAPTLAPTMPRPSTRKDLLNAVDKAALALAKLQYQNELLDDFSNSDSDADMDSVATDDEGANMTFSSPTPPSLISSISGLSGPLDSSGDESDDVTAHYDRLQHTIAAFRDEVERARVIHKPDEPPP
jgi:hypothetical protein